LHDSHRGIRVGRESVKVEKIDQFEPGPFTDHAREAYAKAMHHLSTGCSVEALQIDGVETCAAGAIA